jgi:putative oxidoreductase
VQDILFAFGAIPERRSGLRLLELTQFKEISMKIASMIARYLLGLIFLVFGADKLYPFIPMGHLPSGVAGQFMGALMTTGYIYIVGVCEAVSGLLLLVNRYVGLALVVLAAVLVNINATNILMAHQSMPMGFFVTLLWLLVAYRYRAVLKPLFRARTAD